MAMTAPVVMASTDGAGDARAGDGGGAPEKMAMTAPVVMSGGGGGGGGDDAAPAATAAAAAGAPEKMAMTAPVIVRGGAGDGGAAAPGATAGSGADGGPPPGGYTMAFLLPAKYAAAAAAPTPTNPKVHLTDVPPRVVAVHKYSGNTTMNDCGGHVAGLYEALARDAVQTTGPWSLQRYNPPFSLPWTKTNEIHVPVDVPVDVPADVPADGGAPAEGATAPAAVSA